MDNLINSIVTMSSRDTKDGIADLICELIHANRKVSR